MCWTLIYIALAFIFCEYEFSTSNVLYRIFSSLFSPQGHGIMWFMYSLIGFYLIIPIISPYLRAASQRELTFIVMLILLAFSLPFISLILDVAQGPRSFLFYFSGFGGYFILGYYLHSHPHVISMGAASIGMAISILAPVVVKLLNIEVAYFSLFWYLSLPVALMCIFWFKLLQYFSPYFNRLSLRTKNVIAILSSYCFGIYLCHILFMKYLVKNLGFIQGINNMPLQICAIFFLTLILSLVFVMIISKTRCGRFLLATK